MAIKHFLFAFEREREYAHKQVGEVEAEGETES